jgi:hypothetical protein
VTSLLNIQKSITYLTSLSGPFDNTKDELDYHVALAELVQQRLKYLLTVRDYRNALIVEAELRNENEILANLIQFTEKGAPDVAAFLAKKAGEDNAYRDLAIRVRDGMSPTYKDTGLTIPAFVQFVIRQIRTIMFGVSFNLTQTKSALIIENNMPAFSIESNIETLQAFCNEYDLKLSKADKGNTITISLKNLYTQE